METISGKTEAGTSYHISDTLAQFYGAGFCAHWPTTEIHLKKGYHDDNSPFWYLASVSRDPSLQVGLSEEEANMFAKAMSIEITEQ